MLLLQVTFEVSKTSNTSGIAGDPMVTTLDVEVQKGVSVSTISME